MGNPLRKRCRESQCERSLGASSVSREPFFPRPSGAREIPSDDWAVLQFDSEEPEVRRPVPLPPPGMTEDVSGHRVLRDAPPVPELYELLHLQATRRQAMPVEPEPPPRRRRGELAMVVGGGLVVAFGIGYAVGQRPGLLPKGPETVPAPTVAAPPPLERLVADTDLQGSPALLPVGPEVPVSPDIGQLVIRSTPAGAEVVLDRVLRGTTPLSLGRLRLGSRTLQLAFGGYDTRQRVIELTPDHPVRVVDLELTPAGAMPPQAAGETRAPGAVQVLSSPAGARLFVDDELVGTVPLLMPGLDPGSHRVRLELDGFRSWSASVLIEPDQRFQIDARLEPDAP